MIKRSAALLCIVGIATAQTAEDYKFLALSDAPVTAKASNADICSFFVDSSFYVLKPIILANSSYTVSFSELGLNGAIDFNICDPLRTTTPECKDAFACLTVNGDNGTVSSFPLSGTDF